MDPFLGEVKLFAGNFAPRGWAFCEGQLLAISANSALFSILGTIYGGDGRTTFGLPDLRGRVAIGEGSGPGLTSRPIGQKTGSETVTLTTNEIPNHNHQSPKIATTNPPDSSSPANSLLANGTEIYAESIDNRILLGDPTTGNAGGGMAHTNIQPVLGLRYIISLQGIYPSRN